MSIQYNYVYTIQGFYYGSWEDETSETNRQDAIQRLKEYRDNQPQYSHRLIKQKEYLTSL